MCDETIIRPLWRRPTYFSVLNLGRRGDGRRTERVKRLGDCSAKCSKKYFRCKALPPPPPLLRNINYINFHIRNINKNKIVQKCHFYSYYHNWICPSLLTLLPGNHFELYQHRIIYFK